MKENWSVIVLTASGDNSLNLVENELRLLKTKGVISSETEILGVRDPSDNIGSGAATLNALYTVTEYLSATNDFTTFNTDVLKQSKILIIHCARSYVFDCGNLKALLTIPSQDGSSEQVLNLEHLIETVTELNTNPETKCLNLGVWVCSSDMSFHRKMDRVKVETFDQGQPAIICVETDINEATKHGTASIDDNNYVKNIIYCGKKEILEKHCNGLNAAPVVSGIVFIPVDLAEDMLVFNSTTPLNRCTYMGLDSGNEPLQVSLFFDILVAMGTEVSEDDFVTGKCGKLYEIKLNQSQRMAVTRARNVLWSALSKYKLKCILLKDREYVYWDDRLSAKNHIQNMLKFGSGAFYYSGKTGCNLGPKVCLLNSHISSENKDYIGEDTAICNSLLQAPIVKIGRNCYVSGVNWVSNEEIIVPDGTAILGFHRNDFVEKQYVILGVHDCMQSNLSDLESGPVKILAQLRAENTNATIENGKIYPNQVAIQDLIDITTSTRDKISQSSRLSIREITEDVNLEAENAWRQNLRKKIVLSLISKHVIENINVSLINFFKHSVVEKWSLEILSTLDELATKVSGNYAKLARVLSSIADLLGCMAGNLGKIRSGPGNNKSWEASFSFLKNSEIDKGLLALKTERQKWMARNDLIVRAARHYERALQILIQNAVLSVKKFIQLNDGQLSEMGVWVIAECPARADLQGGWTDTPPICYELLPNRLNNLGGGSVVNVAFLVDGKKPIGAKARRIPELKIVFKSAEDEVEINSVQDLADFNEPSSPAALLKAAIVTTDIISLSSTQNLHQQLDNLLQSGLEVTTWSNLPRGSGLGTSSILASAVIAVLWTVSGKIYTKNALLHAVLYLEQLMTTGGGWQDQVGGVMGGINRGFSLPELPLRIQVEKITPNDYTILNQHLLLIYTGKVRLAKNLLQNVIRNWYARDKDIVQCFQLLLQHSFLMAKAISEVDLAEIGKQMDCYWEFKKILAPGCDPIIIRDLMGLLRPKVWGQTLVGAGGGGFMCLLTKMPNDKIEIEKLIKEANFPGGGGNITVHSVIIDTQGITVKNGEQIIDLID